MYSNIGKEIFGTLKVSFIERLFLLCPLLGVSFIRGSPVTVSNLPLVQ